MILFDFWLLVQSPAYTDHIWEGKVKYVKTPLALFFFKIFALRQFYFKVVYIFSHHFYKNNTFANLSNLNRFFLFRFVDKATSIIHSVWIFHFPASRYCVQTVCYFTKRKSWARKQRKAHDCCEFCQSSEFLVKLRKRNNCGGGNIVRQLKIVSWIAHQNTKAQQKWAK